MHIRALEALCAGALATVTAIGLGGLWYRHTLHERMIQALDSWDAAVVASCIRQGESLNQPGRYGTTPLMVAARCGDSRLAQQLIRQGAQVNARNDTHDTAFLIAAQASRLDVLQVLAAEHADFSADEALRRAAACGQAGSINWLIQHGANVEFRGADGFTPLMAAVLRRDRVAVAALLACGANLNASVVTTSALDLAEQKNTADIARLLRIYGGHGWRAPM
jgi:ankyrin repeat protein